MQKRTAADSFHDTAIAMKTPNRNGGTAMKSKLSLALAASMFTLALAANSRGAWAAKKGPAPKPTPDPVKLYPLPKFHFTMGTGVMDTILLVLWLR